MIKELDRVVLSVELPSAGLQAGDVGTVVMVHDEGAGYEVEFITLDGETIAVETLTAHEVRPVRHGEITHARQVESA